MTNEDVANSVKMELGIGAGSVIGVSDQFKVDSLNLLRERDQRIASLAHAIESAKRRIMRARSKAENCKSFDEKKEHLRIASELEYKLRLLRNTIFDKEDAISEEYRAKLLHLRLVHTLNPQQKGENE